MPPQRRQSTSKAPPQTTAPSSVPSPIIRPPPTQPSSKLKIHPLLDVYETTISSLIGTLSEDPFRRESVDEHARKLIQCEKELEEALQEVKQHLENTAKIQRLQRENTELSKLFDASLTSLSEARTLLQSLPDPQNTTTIKKIPYQLILEYASKISKFTSPPPQWDHTRPQQPGTYVPWPSEDALRKGRLAQLAVEGLRDEAPLETKEEEMKDDMEVEEHKEPRRNPGRSASSVEARRRKMSQAGEPTPILRGSQREMDFQLDLFNPDEES